MTESRNNTNPPTYHYPNGLTLLPHHNELSQHQHALIPQSPPTPTITSDPTPTTAINHNNTNNTPRNHTNNPTLHIPNHDPTPCLFHLPDQYAADDQGDSTGTKLSHHFRVFFQNINGFKWNYNQLDVTNKCHQLQAIQVDSFGIAETNLDFRQFSVAQRFRTLLTHPFNKQISFHTSSSKPVFPTPWKPGGTLTALTGKWTSRVIEKGEDPSGTGTWSYVKFRGKAHKTIVQITIYRLCHMTDNQTHGPETVYSQIYSALQPPPLEKPRLRKRCDKLLFTQLQQWIALQYEIILLTDANEPLRLPARGFHKRMEQLNMKDPFVHLHPNAPNFPTYFRGSNRIDFAYVTHNLLPHVRKCGYLTYHASLDGDHRGIFIDFDEHGLLGAQDKIVPPLSRVLQTSHASRAFKYYHLLLSYANEKHLVAQIATLQHNMIHHPTNANLQLCYDSIDHDLTRSMLAAENRYGQTYPSAPWSPDLRNSGLAV